MRILIGLLLSATFWASCTPKAGEKVIEQSTPKVIEDVPCPRFANVSGYKRELAENAFVLYKDYYGMGKYDEAMPYWRQAFALAPGSNGRVKSHFDDGVSLYAELMNKTDDEGLKTRYMDTIKTIYSKREECFDVDAAYYGQKGFDYYYKLRDYVDSETIYQTFKKSIDVANGKVEYFIINPFTKVLYDRLLAGEGDRKEASSYAVKLDRAVQEGVANCKGKECDSWAIINEYAPNLLQSFEGFDGFYDCNYYTEKYFTLFEQNPEDCEAINKALARMLRGGCDESMEQMVAVKAAKEDKCYTPPPPPGTLRQGYNAYQKGDYKKAVELFEKYVNENDDNEKKAKYLLLIAKIYYGDIKNYPESRKYALKAAKVKEGWGEPYILIGKLYASSGPLCGPGRGWDSQVVTWPAIDMFTYAKKIDPSVADEANKWIRTYKKYMPKKEDIFLRGIKAGSTYFVPCWIRENTIVRTAD